MMKSVKILLTGADGQLGQEFKRAFETGTTKIGPVPTVFRNAVVTYADINELDVTNEEQADDFVKKGFDFVINCSAYTAVDKAESDRDNCYRVNAAAPLYLAKACKKYNATLAHFSTDYVYGGEKTSPYVESDECRPETVYGKTKLEGERNVEATCSKYFIFRTAWLYGKYGNNFVYKMLQLAKNRSVINVVCDQFGTPTYANDLVYTTLNALTTNAYGVYNCSGEGQCSWYEFAREIFAQARVDAEVVPVTSDLFETAAKRPKYSVMDNCALKRLNLNGMREWKTALHDFIQEIND
ncbi:MAG: dTDP-4-dehydrorhamnose reductase [Firmicutes bacterium]|nr:dTDP-4-dehydrorhamnose reductase [Bacillota bacterium]